MTRHLTCTAVSAALVVALALPAWAADDTMHSASASADSTYGASNPDAMPPYTPDPGPRAGNWEATLTGTGQSDDDFDNSAFGVTGSLGYYFTKNLLLTFKQGLSLDEEDDLAGNSTLINGRSVLQGAYQWDLGKWQPYLGLNVGAVYGASIDDEAIFGPELGLKYFVNESTFMFGNIGYEVPFDECCNNGSVPYSLGIGFTF